MTNSEQSPREQERDKVLPHFPVSPGCKLARGQVKSQRRKIIGLLLKLKLINYAWLRLDVLEGFIAKQH